MIFKSYLVENNKKFLLEKKSLLFYGENLGLKKHFQTIIKILNPGSGLLKFTQDEVIKNINTLNNEINNLSLFENKKIIFIDNCNDKIYPYLENSLNNKLNVQLIIFSDTLDKKSKLRKYYETSKVYGIVPCYPDNEISLKKLILERLSGYQGLSPENVNLILESSGLDRIKLENELSKITTYFDGKIIMNDQLIKLLNIVENENFNLLRDEALIGNKIKINKLLSDTSLLTEKNIFYLAVINQRLSKLSEILNISKTSKIEEAINLVRPPVFWKDKQIFIAQAKKWTIDKINKILKKTYKIEILAKSNSDINIKTLIKKLLIDICNTANS